VWKMTKKIVLFILALVLGAVSSHSQTRPRQSLQGLHGVFLYVLPVAKEVEAGGLSTTQVQKATEKALRDAGIEIYAEPQPAEGSANLAVTIDIVKYSDAAYLYSVNVSLLQEARLVRLPEEGTFPAQTWMAGAFGITGTNRMDLILEPLKAKVADFVQDFKAANSPAKK
jgi:hypothetical protein